MSNVELASGAGRAVRFGKYELLEKIGSGGMAEIYRARLTGIGGFEKVVVVKRILPSFAANRAFVKMLIAEAKLSSALHHTNIVQIYELGEFEGQPFIAMEFVHGRDLLQVLGRATKLKQRLPLELALFIVSEMCRGLDYAHQATDSRDNPLHIIHRDVSPSNIIVSFDGLVKLTDFGVARASLERKQQTRSGVLKGKLGYMSPEQVLGAEFDHRADIFSAGIILYESITLKRLFLGKTDLETLINIRDARLDHKLQKHSYIPEGVQAILRRALAREPDERYQTAREFHEALQDYLFEERLRTDNARLGAFVRDLFSSMSDEAAAYAKGPNTQDTSAIRVLTGPGSPAEESSAPVGDDVLPRSTASAFEGAVEESESDKPRTSVEGKGVPPRSRARLRISGHESFGAPEPSRSDAGEPDPEPSRSGLSSATFHLRNHEGQVFGPITYSNFVNLLKTRSISEDELVRVNSGEWQPVREMNDLHDLLPTYLDKLQRKPRHEGPINQLTMPRLVYQLTSGRETGVLKLSRGSTVKEVYFKAGRPRHIASSMKHELFGNYLVDQQELTSAQLQRAIEHARNKGTKLGEALLALRFAEPYQLFRLLSAQFRSKFREIFGWKHGWHEFHGGVSPEGDVVPLELEPLSVLAEGVREYYTLETLEVYFKDHLDHAYEHVRKRLASVEDLRLSARESRLYSFLGSVRTLREALRLHGRKPEARLALLRIAFMLHQVELLSFEDH